MLIKEVVHVNGANYIVCEYENDAEREIFQYRYDLLIIEIDDYIMILEDKN